MTFKQWLSFFDPFGATKKPTVASVPPTASPVAKVPETSCLTKGVAKLWLDGKGWKISKKKSFIFGRAFNLTHAESGVTLSVEEFTNFASLYSVDVHIGGKTMGICADDSKHLMGILEKNPYPALKRRKLEEERREKERESQIKALEVMGCPIQPDSQNPFVGQLIENQVRSL